MRTSMTEYVLVAVTALLGTSCQLTSPDPLFCRSSADCNQEDGYYCDLQGLNGELANTCVLMTPSTDGGMPDAPPPLDGSDPCQVKNCESPTPACIVDENNEGQCVECDDNTDCTTSSNGPVCSGEYKCGCDGHDDCPSTICGYDGVCVKESEVVYVDGENGADDDPTANPPIECGEMKSPCKTIAVAQSKIGADREWMYLFAHQYADGVTVSDGTLNLVGADESSIVPLNSPALTVTGTAKVVVEKISLRTAADGTDAILCQGETLQLISVTVQSSINRAILAEANCELVIHDSVIAGNGTSPANIGNGISIVDSASLQLTQSQVTDNGGIGVSIDGSGSLVIEQCEILRNSGGGVSISDAAFQVKNNIIAGNGANDSAFGGMQITGSAVTGTLGFNTITGNISLSGVAPSGVACNAAGTSSLTLSNNIVWGNPTDNEPNQVINSAVCLWSYSVLGSDETTPDDTMGIGAGNLSDDPMLASDYRLTEKSPCIDAAEPGVELTTVDIDGDQRPIMVKELRKDIGADEFVPTSSSP